MSPGRLGVSRVSQRRTVRLISNANHKPPVLEKLASSYGARAHLEALESVTSARQNVQQKRIPGLAPEALASGYGFTYINAALAYTRPRRAELTACSQSDDRSLSPPRLIQRRN